MKFILYHPQDFFNQIHIILNKFQLFIYSCQFIIDFNFYLLILK